MMEEIAKADASANGPRISLSLHCESAELIKLFIERVKGLGLPPLQEYSEARPPLSERLSVHEATLLADAAGCRINLLHLSSEEALRGALEAKSLYPALDVRLETTLHHLCLSYDELEGTGLGGKVNPPIRTKQDVEALWRAVMEGSIDWIASDHACCMEELKGDDLWPALPGFGGTALLYPVLISEAFHKRGIPLERIAELVARNPARAFACAPAKGSIEIGADADLAIVDVDRTSRRHSRPPALGAGPHAVPGDRGARLADAHAAPRRDGVRERRGRRASVREVPASARADVTDVHVELVMPARRRYAPTALLVHGGAHGGWCYEAWQARLAEHGWRSAAVTLRGRAPSRALTREELLATSTADFVDDVLDAAGQAGDDLVLVGHSFGGVFAQLAAPRLAPEALVLVGTKGLTVPGREGDLPGEQWPLFPLDQPVEVSLETVRDGWLGCPSQELAAAIHRRLVPETPLIFDERRRGLFRMDPGEVRCPVLVVVGEADPSAEAGELAGLYGGDLLVIEETGHEVMLEPRAIDAIDAIERWLAARVSR